MLTLPEELLLLALNDKKGTDNLGHYLDRALIAAALMDLVLQGRIVRQELKSTSASKPESCYYLSTATVTGNAYLDNVLKTIANHPKSDRLHSFKTLALVYLYRTNPLSPIIYATPPNQRLLAAQDLLAAERLIETETRFLFVREPRLLQSNRPTGEVELRERLHRESHSGFVQADERLRALLLLMKSTGLIEHVWDRARIDVVDWQIAQTLRLTMNPNSLLADAHRYIVSGINEEDLTPLIIRRPVSQNIDRITPIEYD